MKLRYSLAILVAAQVCIAHASNNDSDFGGAGQSLAQRSAFNISSINLNSNTIQKNGWYNIGRNAILEIMEPVNNAAQANVNVPSNGQLDLGQGAEVSVLEISPDNRFVLIGVDEDIKSENPGVKAGDVTLAWVRIEELRQAGLSQVDAELSDQVGSLSLNKKTAQNILADTPIAGRRGGHAHRRGGGGHGMTYCLRDVRLTAARFTSTSHIPQVSMASEAYGPYKADGWHPIEYSSGVPVGTACFFGGGRSCGRRKCGHSAIKISANAWKGAGVRPTPFIAGRPLIGCLTPP